MPEGISMATIGLPARFINPMASPNTPATSLERPVPRSASIRTSLPANSASACSFDRNCVVADAPPTRIQRRYMAAASRLRAEAESISSTFTMARRRRRSLATTNPSPPLFPLPQTIVSRLPATGANRLSMTSDAPDPARSIRVRLGTRASMIVRRSRACICIAVTMFILRPALRCSAG